MNNKPEEQVHLVRLGEQRYPFDCVVPRNKTREVNLRPGIFELVTLKVEPLPTDLPLNLALWATGDRSFFALPTDETTEDGRRIASFVPVEEAVESSEGKE